MTGLGNLSGIESIYGVIIAAAAVTLALLTLWRTWGKPVQQWFRDLDVVVESVNEQLKINGEDLLLPPELQRIPLRSLVIRHIVSYNTAVEASRATSATTLAAAQAATEAAAAAKAAADVAASAAAKAAADVAAAAQLVLDKAAATAAQMLIDRAALIAPAPPLAGAEPIAVKVIPDATIPVKQVE